MKKTEYIKQLKQLIKKYHPDLCTDEHLESMYNEITIKLTNALNNIKNENPGKKNREEKNKPIKEPDYEYYKSGINYYRNIHPNQFYERNSDTTYETKIYDKMVAVLNNIYLSFNLSEYYFNKIIKEYPQSPWAEDSREKINLLKKLYKSYENIDPQEKKIINSEQFVSEMGLKLM